MILIFGISFWTAIYGILLILQEGTEKIAEGLFCIAIFGCILPVLQLYYRDEFKQTKKKKIPFFK
jgi:hypothetical protein